MRRVRSRSMPLLRPLLMLVVLAAVAASAATATAAVAGLQDDRLPVVEMSGIAPRLDTLAASGARVSRFDVFWSQVASARPADATNPDDPAYDWGRTDAVLAGMAARGIRPLVSVYSTPDWAAMAPRPADMVWNPYAPAVARDYAAFLVAVVRRYDGVRVLPGVGRAVRLRAVEIWNEPNLQFYLRPQYRAGRPAAARIYAGLVRAAYPMIKKVRPDVIVLAGATGPKSTNTATGRAALDWLRSMRTARLRFDAYSQHVYPAALPTRPTRAVPAWSTLPVLLAELDRFPGKRRPMWITEAGYTTAPTTYRQGAVSEAQQARAVRQIFANRVVRSARIPVVVWFNMQDNPDWPAGLMRADGSFKPSWSVFAARTRLGTLPAPLRPAP